MNLEENYIPIETSRFLPNAKNANLDGVQELEGDLDLKVLDIEQKKSFFFDTYAFFEILKGNSFYNKYTSAEIITTKLNLFELYLGILRENGEENANKVFDKYFPFIEDFDEKVIKSAAQLKLRLNKRDLSMADCIGYSLAKQLSIKFLTGDKQFEDMKNVEFVK